MQVFIMECLLIKSFGLEEKVPQVLREKKQFKVFPEQRRS